MQDHRLSVFVTTYNNDRNASLNHQEYLLRELHRLSDRKYVMVGNPDDADIILLVDVWEDIWKNGIDCWIDNLGNHPIIKRYPEKSFTISDIDAPVILHHGIYASGEK